VIDAPLGSFTYSSPTFTIKKAAAGGPTLDHFAVTAANGAALGAQTAGHAFSVRITAKSAGGATVTGFSGSVVLSSNATCAAGCSTQVTSFVDGVATRSITLTKARTGATVTATLHGGTKHGTSTSFAVKPAAASKLAYVNTSKANLTAGSARTLTVKVEDTYGNVVSTGSHTVHFAKVSGTGTVTGLPVYVACTSGVASKSVTGKNPGALTIRATSGTLAAASITFTVVAKT